MITLYYINVIPPSYAKTQYSNSTTAIQFQIIFTRENTIYNIIIGMVYLLLTTERQYNNNNIIIKGK